MMDPSISKGNQDRLDRVMELRSCNLVEALEFCISAGWLAAEKLEMRYPKQNKSTKLKE